MDLSSWTDPGRMPSFTLSVIHVLAHPFMASTGHVMGLDPLSIDRQTDSVTGGVDKWAANRDPA